MGGFIAMAGIFEVPEADVVSALTSYAKERGGGFEPADEAGDDEAILYSANNRTSLLFPHEVYDWCDISQALSEKLNKVVIALHIHDGDLWMYDLYKGGQRIDGFNPIPDYWDADISDDERNKYRGDASVVSAAIPGVAAQDIERYFVTWNLESDEASKAYPTDEHDCIDWQMCDFIKKLGLVYPVGEEGERVGTTYRFTLSK